MKRVLFYSLLLLFANVSLAQGYKVGDVATDFNLKNVDGKMVSLSAYDDASGFIVIFTCNHCPYSIAYEDRIIDIDQKFKDKGYPIIAINPNDPELYPDDSFDNMVVRTKQKGFTFPYLFDEEQNVYPVYGATRTPHVYLLKKEDKGLIVKYIGAIDNNHSDTSAATVKYLENAVNALLEGKNPNPDFTKAIGCSIKPKAKE
jgi:peroxiredoxin